MGHHFACTDHKCSDQHTEDESRPRPQKQYAGGNEHYYAGYEENVVREVHGHISGNA